MSKKILGVGLEIIGIAGMLVPGLGTAVAWAARIGGAILSTAGGRLVSAARAATARRAALLESLNVAINPYTPGIWCFGETTLPNQLVYAEVEQIQQKIAWQIAGGCMRRR